MFHVWFQYCHNEFYFHNEFYCFLRDFYRVINLYKCKMQNEGDYKYPGDYKYAGWLQINHYITVVLITLRYEINTSNHMANRVIYPKSPEVAMWLRINLIQTQQTRNSNTTNQEQESLNNKTTAFFYLLFL